MGIDPGRPLVTQVSRFDRWKDPSGVVEAYILARQAIPGLQLALLGLSQATDDREACVDKILTRLALLVGEPEVTRLEGIKRDVPHFGRGLQDIGEGTDEKGSKIPRWNGSC